MAEPRILVLDASVGVKWIKPEAGRDAALGLLRAHREGSVRIVVAALFHHEVVAVSVRHGGPRMGRDTWRALTSAGLTTIALDDRLAEVALAQCELLGCTFYDALAPAIAAELGATLCSADSRAHARVEGVELL
ncbi:MAG: type II toxin-antitoxin system VapC family toxin [Coriobacteriia bacterium]|nr:type II toxin-antitoxin system VapC family toxin [Coriobacteriia bacterium]